MPESLQTATLNAADNGILEKKKANRIPPDFVEMYAKLVEYAEVAEKDKYGCIKVPRDHELGLWVKDLKNKKRKFESADDEQTRNKRLYLDKDKSTSSTRYPFGGGLNIHLRNAWNN